MFLNAWKAMSEGPERCRLGRWRGQERVAETRVCRIEREVKLAKLKRIAKTCVWVGATMRAWATGKRAALMWVVTSKDVRG
jgi:hypothetical protein